MGSQRLRHCIKTWIHCSPSQRIKLWLWLSKQGVHICMLFEREVPRNSAISMVLYSLATPGQQQLLFLKQQYTMMEQRLQQQQSPAPASPSQGRPRQINCVYMTDAKPAAFSLGINPEAAALCTSSSNLPTRSSVSSANASTFSPTLLTPSGSTASSTPPPAPVTTTRTSFMISDILDSPSSRRACSTSSSVSAPAEEIQSYRAYSEDPPNGRDSPRSIVSDDVERKEREDSVGASDSDVERHSGK